MSAAGIQAGGGHGTSILSLTFASTAQSVTEQLSLGSGPGLDLSLSPVLPLHNVTCMGQTPPQFLYSECKIPKQEKNWVSCARSLCTVHPKISMADFLHVQSSLKTC